MYKLFFALRYLRKRRVAIFAVLSVWLCVAMVLIVISVMGGFLDMVKDRSRGLLGDLIVDNATLEGFPYYQEFIDELYEEMSDQVEVATPVIYNYGLIRMIRSGFTKPVSVVGIRLDEYRRVNDFGSGLYYDRYYPGTTTLDPHRVPLWGLDEQGFPALPDEYEQAWQTWCNAHRDDPIVERYKPEFLSWFRGPGAYDQSGGAPGYAGDESDARPGIIVGCDIINKRNEDASYTRFYPRGSEMVLTLLPITRYGTLVEGGKPIARAFHYTDDSRTGVYEIDSLHVYVDFDTVQRLLYMDPQELVEGGFTPARARQIQIKLKPGTDPLAAKSDIQYLWTQFVADRKVPAGSPEARLLGDVGVETWEQRQAPFISAVEKEKVLVTMLFGVISLVAVVLIGCTFYMIVSNKTRDIGILKSVGASRAGVAMIFILFGAAVGVVGSGLGVATGTVFVQNINEIQTMLANINPQWRVWSPEVYTFDSIPNVVKFSEAATIGVLAVLLSMIGALIPAVIAARVWPASALRYE
ncbi:MAG: ABC transporter permease [Planctomycetes bacterium]|nr:ABC transporter permease [Planctomycetota bacterium]